MNLTDGADFQRGHGAGHVEVLSIVSRWFHARAAVAARHVLRRVLARGYEDRCHHVGGMRIVTTFIITQNIRKNLTPTNYLFLLLMLCSIFKINIPSNVQCVKR